MLRKWITIVLCLPAVGAAIHWLVDHPSRREAPAIAAATFGGLAVLTALFTLAVPVAVRRRDPPGEACRWRRAAVEGLPLAVFFTFLWSFLSLPDLLPREKVFLGLAGAICVALALFWSKRLARHRGAASGR